VSPTGRWAFTGPWDARSAVALQRAAPHLDAAITGWIALDTLDGTPRRLFPDSTQRQKRFAPRRLALVTSWMGERFHPATLRRLADDPARLVAVGRDVAHLVAKGRYRGVVLDFEDHAAEDSLVLAVVTEGIAQRVRANGGSVALAVPAGEAPAYRSARVLAAVDRVVVMLYDEHWSGSAPGPVASPDWASARLGEWVAAVGAGRVVAALPSYGYYWRNAAPGAVIGYADLLRLSLESGTPIRRDDASGAAVVALPDSGEAWYTDAPALSRLLTVAKEYDIGTVALWRLGLDDPALWPEPR
jgi:spore germination protein YaaH